MVHEMPSENVALRRCPFLGLGEDAQGKAPVFGLFTEPISQNGQQRRRRRESHQASVSRQRLGAGGQPGGTKHRFHVLLLGWREGGDPPIGKAKVPEFAGVGGASAQNFVHDTHVCCGLLPHNTQIKRNKSRPRGQIATGGTPRRRACLDIQKLPH
jgi:hypothetical protein